jgi:hypothetical protein
MTPDAIYDLCGGFSSLAFLLAYLLVSIAGWRHGAEGVSWARVRGICGGSALVLIAILVAFLAGAVASQGAMLIWFAGLTAIGALLVRRGRLPSA